MMIEIIKIKYHSTRAYKHALSNSEEKRKEILWDMKTNRGKLYDEVLSRTVGF